MIIGFTGHRPPKLGGYNRNSEKNLAIMSELKEIIIEVMQNSNEKDFKFIFGGALGLDQIAFSICYRLRNKIQFIDNTASMYNYNIILESAIPFINQAVRWNPKDIKFWEQQIAASDIVTYVDTLYKYKVDAANIGMYHPLKMQKRNEYIVDNSDLIIAIWDGSKSGTSNCVDYAIYKNKSIIILNPQSFEIKTIDS